MLDDLLDKIKTFLSSRIIPLAIIIILMFFVMVRQLFQMQIVEGADIAGTSDYKETTERDIKSTRGLIYDRNGVLLAYNESKYAVVMSQSAQITNNSDRNAMIYRLIKLLEKYNNELELDFCIEIAENGELAFNVSGNAELRFKKAVYCVSFISDLTEEQKNATAEEVFEFLKSGTSIFQNQFGISDQYSLEDALKIMTVRYTLMIQAPQYTQFVLASNVSMNTVAAIKENMGELPGVDIKQQTYRVYNDSLYFAHILGYTGLINTAELENLNKDLEVETYKSGDYVGKKGIEKSMDSYLSGTKGIEQLVINSDERVLETEITLEPVKGNDIYLTIDRDLQVACYYILERNLAAILISKINNGMDYGTKGTKAAGIKIPIYEVYNALISNNVIDIKHFKEADATPLEQRVLGYFEEKRETILSKLSVLLDSDNKTTNTEAGAEMEEYLEYIYQLMQSDSAKNLVVRDKVDRNDTVYLDYIDNKISTTEYLKYAITKRWVDLSVFEIGNYPYSTDEIYDMMIEYVFEILMDDKEFEKMIYETLIFNKKLTGKEICLLLFDQNVLEYTEGEYNRLSSGSISAYDFMIQKIKDLEITPAQLALEPCSGSIVIADVNTGDVYAMVSYPSYDNNKMANKIDWDYYSILLDDASYPEQNRPTQELTTTGSTFKPLTSLIALGENLITTTSTTYDRGVFDLIDPSPSCWKHPGSHGSINVSQALMHSCNYFYYDIGYRLSSGSDALGIKKIQEYATMFGLADKTGVEVEESTPSISNRDAVRTAIGYYHNFSPVQIARYISTVANRGTCYDFTLIDQIKSIDGTVVYTQEPKVHNEITMFSQSEWDAVQKGMNWVVNTSANSLNSLYSGVSVTVAGKTGTAQVSTTKPHHALFTSFAPYENPEISVTIVIPNGYASANAAYIGKEVYGLYYNNENKEALLSGNIKAGTATDIKISD